MTIYDVYLLGCLALLVALIWQHLEVSRRARSTAKKACEKQQLLLLDQSVILIKLRPRKSNRAFITIERTYGFEFSTTGDQRYRGELLFEGNRLKHLELQAHKI